jgi:colanic acid/amylovoran biosynthesis glycosyltransferase
VNVVVSQALAMGLPVIATRHSGLPEQVMDGKNGFLVDEGDYAALAMAIARLSADPTLLTQLSAAGRDHVRENYSSDAMIDRQIQLYLGLVADASSHT